MCKNLLIWLTSICIFPSCTRTAPNILVVCEENEVGNCVIKWDAPSYIKGYVKIYSSLESDNIPEKKIVGMAPVSAGKMVFITNNPSKRYYYSAVFDGNYRVKIAARNVNIPGVQDFRDIGGYPSKEKKVRWGMIYRSAKIDCISAYTELELKNIGVRTVIDLRTDDELTQSKPLSKAFNVIRVPIPSGNMETSLKSIRQGQIGNDSIHKLLKQVNRDLVVKYKTEYQKIFNILVDSTNYPVVIECTNGKERTGIITALILGALNVDESDIMKDYELSNNFFNIAKVSKYAYKLPPKSQEAITTVYTAKKEFLDAAKENIEKNYGNVETYLKNEIGLSKNQIKELREILLEER